jgi:cysteine desulfurase
MNKSIYLDNHATTKMDERVLKEMLPYFCDKYGNPASIDHIYGNETQTAVDEARKKIASSINANEEEIIFTSGATESDNLALSGIVEYLKNKGNHIITTKIEHKAILDTCKKLESKGFKISYLDVNKEGVIDLKELNECIRPETILISIMAANNEIGVIQPIKKIGELAKNNNIVFHTDAAQAFGYISLNVNENKIDLMSLSGHKIYGPKGIGILYVRKGVKLEPLILGGGHERGLRSGTLNTPLIVGMGKACEIFKKEDIIKIKQLRDKLFDGIKSKSNIELNGSFENRLPNNLNIYLPGISAKALINEVKDKIAISSGSACTSTEIKPSHVILALGYEEGRADSSIRIGLGRFNTEEEINSTIKIINETIYKLNNL